MLCRARTAAAVPEIIGALWPPPLSLPWPLPFLWLLPLPPPLLPLLGRKLNIPLARSATVEDMEERG